MNISNLSELAEGVRKDHLSRGMRRHGTFKGLNSICVVCPFVYTYAIVLLCVYVLVCMTNGLKRN